ncbi:hypothetical protein GCM10009849_35010 [Sinomonas flava]|uniref:Uncharacterized protein n=1 Tax=Sinomonas flava TaxID=496857 RepID=A0ABN3C205_9MICC
MSAFALWIDQSSTRFAVGMPSVENASVRAGLGPPVAAAEVVVGHQLLGVVHAPCGLL